MDLVFSEHEWRWCRWRRSSMLSHFNAYGMAFCQTNECIVNAIKIYPTILSKRRCEELWFWAETTLIKKHKIRWTRSAYIRSNTTRSHNSFSVPRPLIFRDKIVNQKKNIIHIWFCIVLSMIRPSADPNADIVCATLCVVYAWPTQVTGKQFSHTFHQRRRRCQSRFISIHTSTPICY